MNANAPTLRPAFGDGLAGPASTQFVISAAAPTIVPVAGSAAVFPVNRVYCIGRNYRWSPEEAAPAEMPTWFMKPAKSVVRAEGVLHYPSCTHDFCHEIELVVAIGSGGQNIDPTLAEPCHIWGYAAGLDLTRRDLQQHAKQAGGPWEAAKSFDHSAPCTSLVPASAMGHPRHGAIWLEVNDIERQRADLSELLWPVRELVAMLSRSVTLLPGDLIFTGTPAGVGALHPGDVVRGGIEGVGQLFMTVGDAQSHDH